MKLKGDFSAGTSYSVGDVVRWENGDIFQLLKPCDAGTTPVNTLYWGKILGPIAEVIYMVIDYVAEFAAKIPTNIDDEGIVLKGTEDAEYLITVDDSGDTPELDVALIESEEAEGGEP